MGFIYTWSDLLYQKQPNSRTPLRSQPTLHSKFFIFTACNNFTRLEIMSTSEIKPSYLVTMSVTWALLKFPWLPIPAFASFYLCFHLDQSTSEPEKIEQRILQYFFFSQVNYLIQCIFQKNQCITRMEEEKLLILKGNIFEIAIWGKKKKKKSV